MGGGWVGVCVGGGRCAVQAGCSGSAPPPHARVSMRPPTCTLPPSSPRRARLHGEHGPAVAPADVRGVGSAHLPLKPGGEGRPLQPPHRAKVAQLARVVPLPLRARVGVGRRVGASRGGLRAGVAQGNCGRLPLRMRPHAPTTTITTLTHARTHARTHAHTWAMGPSVRTRCRYTTEAATTSLAAVLGLMTVLTVRAATVRGGASLAERRVRACVCVGGGLRGQGREGRAGRRTGGGAHKHATARTRPDKHTRQAHPPLPPAPRSALVAVRGARGHCLVCVHLNLKLAPGHLRAQERMCACARACMCVRGRAWGEACPPEHTHSRALSPAHMPTPPRERIHTQTHTPAPLAPPCAAASAPASPAPSRAA